MSIPAPIIGGRGWEQADDWAALFACCIIAFNGYRLLLPALREVMDSAPSKELESAVRIIAAGVHGVAEV